MNVQFSPKGVQINVSHNPSLIPIIVLYKIYKQDDEVVVGFKICILCFSSSLYCLARLWLQYNDVVISGVKKW